MRILKSSVWLALVVSGLLASGRLTAQAPDQAAALLEAAIQKQVIARDLAGAAADYEAILGKFGGESRIAGQALWRLGQCQEQLGQLDRARRSYQRLLREYSNQPALATAAQGRLAALLEIEDLGEGDLSRVVVDPLMKPESTDSAGPGGGFTILSDLAVFFPTTGVTQRLLSAPRAAAYPVVSPDRQRVAYFSWDGDLQEKRRQASAETAVVRTGAELRIIEMNGRDDRQVVRSADLRWLRPLKWSADAESILTLLERRNGTRQLALVGAADGSIRVLKSLPWLSVQDVAFSGDGEFLAYQLAAPVDSRQFDLFILPLGTQPGPRVERRYSLTLGGQRGAKVTEDELVVHVLNRLGFGPRPGDIERVKAMGVDAYIEQQLHPERLPDPGVDATLAGFTSLKMDIRQVLETSGPVVDLANRRRATIFERSDMMALANQQKTPDPNQNPARVSADPLLMMPDNRPLDTEVQTARAIRAVHSTRQLQEVMVDFWMNHFNVNLGDHQMTVTYEEQGIRRHTLGKFENLLSAVAHDPRMLFYLDNWRSSAPMDMMKERMAEMNKSADTAGQVAMLERLQAFTGEKGSKGLNENFARELLELHTVGVDGGYTQQDVIAVARILSGWTIGTRGVVNGHEDDGVFMFDPLMHIPGDKVVMGQTFKSGGVEEGEQLLKMLAHHPSTARHLATKLARRFVADDPPPALVDSASRVFLRTGGDIREVVKAIITSPEFRAPEAPQAKIKKPFELIASALRAVEASFENLDTYSLLVGGNNAWVSRMGEKVYNHEAPDGNPDVAGAWMNSNALLLRLDFANRLAANKVTGIKVNLPAAERLLTQLGIPKPTPQQIEQTRTMLRSAAAQAAPAMGGQQMMMMAGGPAGADANASIDPAAIVVAAMLGSPQFQKR